MKDNKILFIVLFSIIFGFVFNLSVFSQNQNTGEYFINGISTKEDLGGVEVFPKEGYAATNSTTSLVFENHNTFPVTVIFEFESGGVGGTKQTGTVVLKTGEKKEIPNRFNAPTNYKLIVRKLRS